MFNFFRKKKSNKIVLHDVNVKIKKGKEKKVYIGQILSISPNEGRNDVYYVFSTLIDDVSNKINDSESEYCEKYNYGIVKEINDSEMVVSIVCKNGYLRRLKTDLNVPNGNSYIVDGYNLIENNKVVGKIIDRKYDPSMKILFNNVEDNRLVSFFEK